MKYTISFQAFCVFFECAIEEPHKYKNVRKGIKDYIKRNWKDMTYDEQITFHQIIKRHLRTMTEFDIHFWDELLGLPTSQTKLL